MRTCNAGSHGQVFIVMPSRQSLNLRRTIRRRPWRCQCADVKRFTKKETAAADTTSMCRGGIKST